MEHWVASMPIGGNRGALFLLTKEASEPGTQTTQFDIFDDNNIQQTITNACARDSQLPLAPENRCVDYCRL
jgi:hypothetical protein